MYILEAFQKHLHYNYNVPICQSIHAQNYPNHMHCVEPFFFFFCYWGCSFPNVMQESNWDLLFPWRNWCLWTTYGESTLNNFLYSFFIIFLKFFLKFLFLLFKTFMPTFRKLKSIYLEDFPCSLFWRYTITKFYFDYCIGKPLRMILMNITLLLFGIWCSFRYIAVFDRLFAWYLSKDIVFSNLLRY